MRRLSLSKPWRALRIGCLLGVLACGAAGCARGDGPPIAQLPHITTDDPRAETDLRAAREAESRGDIVLAEQLYTAFLTDYPNDPLVPLAKLELGRIRLAAGDTERARELFQQVSVTSDPALAERGRFYLGIAYHLSGQHEASITMLRPLAGRTVDPEETAMLWHTLAAASQQTGNRIEAAVALDELASARVADADREDATARLTQLIMEEASAEDIATLYDRLGRGGIAWPLVARREARAAFAAGNMTRVQAVLDEFRDNDIPFDDELEAIALRVERTGEADPHVIGAVLPLSGRGSEVGQSALKGLMLASNTPSHALASQDATQLVFRDSMGTAEQAARAVDDLVTLHRVIAIIGPVGTEPARAAAERAQELGVPLIALSPHAELTEVGDMIFRNFFTPQGEIRELVAAARRRGANRFIVLHADHGYGHRMQALFAREVTEQRGEVVTSLSYPAGSTSFREIVEALSNLNFDAVLIPDSSRQVALLAPTLAAAGWWSTPQGVAAPPESTPITLLVPSVGYADSLIRSSSRYLQGALFSLPFHAPSDERAEQIFADSFQERFGIPANNFAAYAYDAFKFVQDAVSQGVTDRRELATALMSAANIDTASPSRGFTEERVPRRETRVLTLTGSTLTLD